jgi:hypothetical protein
MPQSATNSEASQLGRLPGTRFHGVKRGSSRVLTESSGRIVARSKMRLFRAPTMSRVTVGRDTFTPRRINSFPADQIAEVDAAFSRGYPRASSFDRRWGVDWVHEMNGNSVLRTFGHHFDKGTGMTYMRFDDGQWLRFPIDGVLPREAVMSAVSPSGETLWRCCYAPRPRGRLPLTSPLARASSTVEILVSPGVRIDCGLYLALMVSAPLLSRFFRMNSGGGG